MRDIFDSKKIADILNSKLIGENKKIEDITLNSKEQLNKTTCFFAIRGEKYDGNNFISEAVKNGAGLIVTNVKPNIEVPYILVDDTKIALGTLGKHNKGGTKIVGITGSAGKTTTKEMIKALLSQKYNVYATRLNENNEIGVAKTLLGIKNHDFCIVEMGMRGLGEIRYLSSIAEPDISVITNAGTAHLERLGTKENIFKAKTEILEYTKNFAIMPSENRFKRLNFKNISPIFIGEKGDVKIEKYQMLENGIKVSFMDNNVNRASREFYINALGEHNAQNSAYAYVIGKLAGLDENEIKKGFCSFKNCNMRGNIKVINKLTIIEDCYNSSYEGMKNAIETLTEYSSFYNKSPYILVGDMLEIGEGSDEYHYRIGEYAKDLGVKNIFSYGNKSKHILDGFCGGLDFKNENALVAYINKNLGERDVLLVKASRDMHFERIISRLKG